MSYTNGLDKPTDYFNTKLYAGTGSSQSITGVGFQPDWIWFKCRQANNHNLFDSIRGSNKILQSSTTIAEATSTALLTSFDSDGFTVNTDDGVNGSSKTYASWNWLASNSTASNTDGSITSTVSANTTSGFSIVSYTGTGANATVGHGLGAVPKMIIVKSRSHAKDWTVYHSALGNTKWIELNSTGAEQSSSNRWNNTSPTSSVFTVATDSSVNASGYTYIAYCFAEKKGYSKFGSYTGNGNADGTFVFCGFKPAFVIIKRTSSTQNWGMYDNKREPFNTNDALLFPNLSNAETSSVNYALDFVSNGFKQRATGNQSNGSGETYIYMAFAENPFVTSSGVPACAK